MLIFAIAPVVVAVGLTLRVSLLSLPMNFVLAAAICLVVFVLVDLIAGNVQSGLWVGYLNLVLLVVWLALGEPVALWVLILGAVLSGVIRLALPGELSRVSAGEVAELAFSRLAVSGFSLLAAMALYVPLAGEHPLVDVQWHNVPALAASLLGALVTSQLLGRALVLDNAEAQALWSAGQRSRLMQELMLLVVAPVLSIVLYRDGPVIFGILMGVMLSMAIRYGRMLRAQQSLVRRIRELSVVNSVGQAVSATLALDDVLLNVYKEIKELIELTGFVVALYDGDHDVMYYRLAMIAGQREQWESTRMSDNRGISGYVIRNRAPLQINRSEQERIQALGIDPITMQHRAYICVPLMVGPKLIGIMAVTHAERDDAFGASEVSILQTVANQAALAIRNATLYDRTVELAHDLSLINRSVQDVMFNLDSDEAMRAACQTTLDIMSADRAAVFLLEIEKKGAVRLAQQIGFTDAMLTAAAILPFDPKRYEDGARTVTNTDLIADDPALSELARLGEFRAFAEVPMRSGNTMVGYLAVYHNQPHFYQQTELELLETLAYQVTAALDNAELLKALELYASEQAQLVHLSRISTATLDLESVASNVSDILRQMIGVSRVAIGVLVPGKERIRLLDTSGAEAPAERETRFLSLDDFPELAAVAQDPARGPVFFHNDDSTLSSSLRGMMDEHGDAALIVVPMVVNNALLGIIFFGNAEPRFLSDGEWRLVEMATNQVATQIHNAQQYADIEQALKRRLAQLSLIEHIAQQISGALDRDELIGNVLEATRQATRADMAALALVEDDKFRIIGQEFIDGAWYEYQTTQPRDAGLIGYVARTGQTQLIAHNPTAPYAITPLAEGLYLSALAVPLVREHEVIGVLSVESVRQDFFTEEQASFLNNLAGHAVISIENARLMEEREYQIETLTSLRQLSLQLSSTIDKHDVSKAVLRTAISIMQGKGASLLDCNDSGKEIHLLASVQLGNGQYVSDDLFIPDSIINETIAAGEIRIIENVDDCEEYRDPDIKRRADYNSLLVVPIHRGNIVRELLCIAFARPRRFLERELSTLELLAIQVAAHVENATLLEKIREGNTRMRAILNATRDGVVLLDREGNLRDANLSAEQIFGITLEDYIGENFPSVLMRHTDTVATGNWLTDMARNLRLQPERITRDEFEISTRGGGTAFIQEVETPVTDVSNNIVGRLLVFHDITEEHSLAEYRDEITHMVVHDLRGPLSSIISSLDVMLDVLKSSEQEAAETLTVTLEISLESAYNLLQLVDSILDIAKLERREMPLERVSVPVRKLAQEAYNRLANSIEAASIKVPMDFPDDLGNVFVDANIITRVLTNLLHNAVKYTKSIIQISAIPARTRDRLIVRVADDGPGVPPDQWEEVFKKYHQVPGLKSPRGGPKGTGLGLAFCKVAIEAHGETIWIEPKGPLPGACFAFTLPIAPEPPSDGGETTPVVVSHS